MANEVLKYAAQNVSVSELEKGNETKPTEFEPTMRYSTGSGAIKHKIYIPYVSNDNGEKTSMNIVAKVHYITNPYDREKRISIACHKHLVDGKVEGECPICDRIATSWNIYTVKYEKAQKDGKCSTEEEAKAVRKALADSRDVKKAEEYIYILITQFELESDFKTPVLDEDGLPKFENKIMKFTKKSYLKLTEQLKDAEDSNEIAGRELTFTYTDANMPAARVAQRTIAFSSEKVQLTAKYKGLEEKINKSLKDFAWDEELPRAYSEFKEKTDEDLKKLMDMLFASFDAYVKENNLTFENKYENFSFDSSSTQEEKVEEKKVEDDNPFDYDKEENILGEDDNPLL